MEQRLYVIRDVTPKGQRKPARVSGVESDHRSDWTDSSMELRRGLDIVELSDTQWSDTLPLDIEPPHRSNWAAD
jgi:hypothetical protein